MIDSTGTLIWKTAVPINGASFPLIIPDLDGGGKIYVGSADGALHELSLATGAQTAVLTVGDGNSTVGSPVYESQSGTIYVGTAAGVIYQYAAPL